MKYWLRSVFGQARLGRLQREVNAAAPDCATLAEADTFLDSS